MKGWSSAIVLCAVILTGGIADARRGVSRANCNHGTRGKITAVGSSGFTMTGGSKDNPQTYRVYIAASTTVKGAKTIDSTLIGDTAMVQGGASGDIITATTVTIHAGHHKKK